MKEVIWRGLGVWGKGKDAGGRFCLYEYEGDLMGGGFDVCIT